MRGKWFVAIASVVLLALVAVAVTILLRAPAKKTQAAPPAATAPVLTGDISLTGKIRPQQVTFVAAPIEGVVSAFFVEVGQEVFEGQLLARIANEGLETGQQDAQKELEKLQSRVNAIESDVITARLEASRAQADLSRSRGEYDRLEKIYRRQQMLYNEGATPKLVYEKSARDFETAQSEFNNLEQVAKNADARVSDVVRRLDIEKRTLEEKTADVDTAKAKTGAAEVVSPVPGMVLARNGDVGLPVTPDKGDFFQIATQLSQLEVVLDPDPPTLLRIKPGQPALVVMAELGGDGMPGVVKTIQGNQAVVAFVSPNAAVKPGMMAQVRIKAN